MSYAMLMDAISGRSVILNHKKYAQCITCDLKSTAHFPNQFKRNQYAKLMDAND